MKIFNTLKKLQDNAVLTAHLFDKYKHNICVELHISGHKYDKIKRTIIKMGGYFDPKKTYCGQGEKGDRLVPDMWFRFAGYCHDNLGQAIVMRENIQSGSDDIVLQIAFSNNYFKATMNAISGKCWFKRFWATVYYKAVDLFYTKEDILEERGKNV